MKKILFVCIILLISVSLICAKGSKEKDVIKLMPSEIRVGALVGPSGVGMAYLFEHAQQIDGVSFDYQTFASVDVLLPKFLNGDIDIGILPPNVAVKLYNANPNSIVNLATVGNGMLSLISKDTSVKQLSDLKGKTITVAGQGSTPEYVFKTLLAKDQIDSVALDFSIPIPEIAPALIADKIHYAVVPEPFATVAIANSKTLDRPVQRIINIQSLWQTKGLSSNFPMTLCVARTEITENFSAIIDSFLEEYNKAIAWTIENPNDAGLLVEKAGLGLKAPIASQAIPSSNYTFLKALDGKQDLESLMLVFLEFSPIAIGGKLPDENFYYK